MGVLPVFTPCLNKMAERAANTAVPGACPSAAYIAYREIDICKAAVESAAETGPIRARERRMLERLRPGLGLSGEDAAAIEADVCEPGTLRAQPAPA